jgi:hypothetical protein
MDSGAVGVDSAVDAGGFPMDGEAPGDASQDGMAPRDAAHRDGAPADGSIDAGADASTGCPAGQVDANGDPSDGCECTLDDPPAETCDGRDNDCNGLVDDGAECPCGVLRQSDASSPYLFCETPRPWDEARTRCQEHGYDLVVLETESEDEWVWARITEIDERDWWMGLEDMDEDGQWRWVDGTAASFLDFGPDQPSGGEVCVEFDDDPAGTWNDEGCGTNNPFVCELP